MSHPSLNDFHPAVARWFAETFGEPTPPQAKGWPLIGAGKNVLLLAPTGSGKTLAAFLKCLDWLYQEAAAGKTIDGGVQVLYISPLKALNNDIYRNLELPLVGIESIGREMGIILPQLKVAVRTGDTPSAERQKMLRRPPQILITTPESLFLLLSSQARQILKTVRFIIIDEIHTLFPTKRGAHLALSLERLHHLVGSKRSLQKIGLSATMRPLDQVAVYLAGYDYDLSNGALMPRPVEVVDTGQRKTLDLKIILPVPDLRELPEKTIWPEIYKKLLELIKEHRTTLIFVNNRRLAERITVNLNQLAETEIAKTHHGSVSKEVRLQVERMLKNGDLSCIVATASLELGIDIGHIDLVIQIESPKEVARGLQRIGRAGHIVGMPSKGRIIPKTRADLLEAAAILREMKVGNVESAKAILNCLDVLAQQIVAMTAEGEWLADEAFKVVCRAYNFTSLARKDFENVLAMLDGNFQTTEFVELRPRLYWDRSSGMIKPDPYGKRLVYSSGGTIPDRGYYGVYLEGSNVRLGELDEEFVYERRLNERFVLGTSVWRIEGLLQDRVIVSAAKKGGEAIVPFWKADLGGRPFELGKRMGAFFAEIEQRLDSPGLLSWLQDECALDQEVAQNLARYLVDQKRVTGYLPTDRRIVIEEFPDEIGEWRVLLHSSFGMKLHTALGLIIKDSWEKNLHIQVEAIPTDDGIMFHLPGGNTPPVIDWNEIPLINLEQKVAELVSGSALFGITFRHAAQLSMIMPRTGYGKKRTPFWLSRLKAANLLQVVAKYPDFPLVMETYRSILQDYFELWALREVLQGLRQGKILVHYCRHQMPSPFASGHLFNFIGAFMYEGETPKSEMRLQLFGLGRETLRAIVGEQGFRELFDLEITKAVTRKAQWTDLLERNPSLESAEQWLEKVGDVFIPELKELFPSSHPLIANQLLEMKAQGKAVALFGKQGTEFLILVSELSLYLKALPSLKAESVQLLKGPQLKSSTKENHLTQDEAIRSLIHRYIRTHGPFKVSDIVKRYGFTEQEVGEELAILAAKGLVEAGEFIPGYVGEEWCDVGLLQEIHQRSLAQARRNVEARSPHEYSSFLARWQGIGSERVGLDGLAATLKQLADLWLPAAVWESSVLPNRVRDFHPSQLDQLIASGQFGWRAKGNGNNLFICFQSTLVEQETPQDTNSVSTIAEQISVLSMSAQNIYRLLERSGALSLPQLFHQAKLSSIVAWQALNELITAGLVTNDTFGPIRYLLQNRPQDRLGVRGVIPPTVLAKLGRWSLLQTGIAGNMENQAWLLINRYGLVCRELIQQEERSWGEFYRFYDLQEQIGKIRRGYFVAGLSGIQYALPAAIEELRLPPEERLPELWVLNWQDPANPLKFFPEWPANTAEYKLSGDYMVFHLGRPILSATGRKLKIKLLTEISTELITKAIRRLIEVLYRVYREQKIVITHYNEQPIIDTEVTDVLKKMGFEKGYQEMTLWPSNRNE